MSPIITPIFSDFAAFQEILAERYQRDVAKITDCLSRETLPVFNIYDGLTGDDVTFEVSDMCFEEGAYDERSGYRAPVARASVTFYTPQAAYGLSILVHPDGIYHVVFKSGAEDTYMSVQDPAQVAYIITTWCNAVMKDTNVPLQNLNNIFPPPDL